jgi:predicted Zn-dependent protease
MTLKYLVSACALLAFSSSASAFDFGKLIEQQLNKNQAKPAAGDSTQKSDSGSDSNALAFGLFGKYSSADEARIGKQIAGDLLGAVPLVRDEALQRYVNEVGNWVALQAGRKDVAWHFGVLDSEDINAFAAPGGYVFVTRGLYKQLNSEAELAGVLGHEIAHVAKKHYLKVLKKSSLISALGEAVGKQVKSNDQTVQNVIGNGAEIMARGLDKDAEFEADRVGVVYAARAGYDPWGLPAVLQDLAALPPKDSRTSLLYKTHPQPSERLTRLGDAIGDRFDKLDGKDASEHFYRLH